MAKIKKIIWLLVAAGTFLIFIVLFRSPILTLYAHLFTLQNAEKGADAIICLSGSRQTRNPESLRLWNQGYAQRLFVTEVKPQNKEFNPLELSHLEFAHEVARLMKLEAKWELLPSLAGGATSTFDEAEDALAYGQRANWKRIIIVTDEFHTRRAHLAFSKVFAGSGLDVQVAGAPNEVFAVDDWWKSDRGILAYLGETIKYPVYWLWDHEPKIVQNF
jgi:uncharacterized SAM-binding protein YcdF (DUF218 family)